MQIQIPYGFHRFHNIVLTQVMSQLRMLPRLVFRVVLEHKIEAAFGYVTGTPLGNWCGATLHVPGQYKMPDQDF